MLTYQEHVIPLVNITEHVTDVKLGRKIQKILTCKTFCRGVVGHPRHRIAVLRLCHTTRPVHRSRHSLSGPTMEIYQQ